MDHEEFQIRVTRIEGKETTFEAVEKDQIFHILECKFGHQALSKLVTHHHGVVLV